MSKKDQKPENENHSPSPIGEIEHGPSGLEAFLDANQKKLIAVGCVLIVAAIAYVISNGLQRKKIETAAAEVSAATEITELREVHERYADTPAGATALMKIAAQQWTDQQQQEAISTLKKAIADFSGHPNLGSMHALLANYHRAVGEKNEAKAQFEAAAALDTSVSSYALQQLSAIALQNGENEVASANLDRVIKDYGTRHPTLKPVTQEMKKLVGITPATVTTPTPTKPAEASSDPVKLPDLPDLPVTPTPEGTPPPVEVPNNSSE